MPSESHLRTAAVVVSGESKVIPLCRKLISASQWFSVTPLPDDRWEVVVKAENESHLRVWAETITREDNH